jgi:hypothetical protein
MGAKIGIEGEWGEELSSTDEIGGRVVRRMRERARNCEKTG